MKKKKIARPSLSISRSLALVRLHSAPQQGYLALFLWPTHSSPDFHEIHCTEDIRRRFTISTDASREIFFSSSFLLSSLGLSDTQSL